MKRWTRKFTSLLLALTIVGAMCSTAFAYTHCPYCGMYVNPTGWSASYNSTQHVQRCIACNQDISEPHNYHNGVCVGCGKNEYTTPGGTVSGGSSGDSLQYPRCSTCSSILSLTNWTCSYPDTGYHLQRCTTCGTTNQRLHTYNARGVCIYCNANNPLPESPSVSSAGTLILTQANGTYNLTSTATQAGASVYDLICRSIPYHSTADLNKYYVSFAVSDSSAATLSGYGYNGLCRITDLDTMYLTIRSGGTWTASYTVLLNGTTPVSVGTVSVVIPSGAGNSISYTATTGEIVPVLESDFIKFWRSYTNSRGTLDYVQITSVTGLSGTLCYGHTSNEYYHNSALGHSFYSSPTITQYDLGKLSFVPDLVSNRYPSGTAAIGFTAYGTSSSALTSASGTITISYTVSSNVPDISYKVNAGSVALSSSDFTDVYNGVCGASYSPVFTIRFLDVPTYGKLHYSYNSGISAGTELTRSNISAYTFTNQISGANAIDRVTYTPGAYAARNDTLRYAVYSGNTLLYTGAVTFDSEKTTVSYHCYSDGIPFTSYEFFYGNTGLINAQLVSFGTPSSGTLYKQNESGKATVVTKADVFSYGSSTGVYSVNSVTYIPKAGFTGVVEIPIYAANYTGNYEIGTVEIYVVAEPFSDVPDDWFTPYVNRLYASKIVSGTTTTTFSPKANMKYGEALKLILQAAGYPKQTEATGNNWAKNYLILAYKEGIVSSTSIDLNDYITRDAMAEIAAKALGLSKAGYVDVGVDGPTDSRNGYVYALYNAGIVSGDSSTGENRFNGSSNINRAEVSKIICNIMDYRD